MGTQTAACAVMFLSAALSALPQPAAAAEGAQPTYTFELVGGYFYGPGPIVPDTHLPDGRLRNIHFDLRAFRGHCEFSNDGTRGGLLSDGRTRINQNIDAGRLLIGGGINPVLLTAVDGGPHRGTEQYYLDDDYRFVWRVDIALDPGFEEGIIRLNDFVLDTGVARVGRSLQSQQGHPGGYDQAGTLKSGDYISGRVGDFDQDGFLDGVLVAAPNVPMAADMLPGAPVANQRGFRTNVPIAAQLSAELMLRGTAHLRGPIDTLIAERGSTASQALLAELEVRVRAAHERAGHAVSQQQWSRGTAGDPAVTLGRLARLQRSAAALAGSVESMPATELRSRIQKLFAQLDLVIREVSAFNERSNARLPASRVASGQLAAGSSMELHPKNY